MDPNQALLEIYELRQTIAAALTNEEAADAGSQLAYLLGDLDQWIRSGGFLPQAWQDQPPPAHEIRLVRRPKMDTPGGVAAVCACGYDSGCNDPRGATRAGAQHLAAKWTEHAT